MPSQSSLRDASSPRGGAIGRPGHFLLDAQGPIRRKRAGLATEGSGFWTNAPCQAVAGLDSGALPFPRHRALLVQTKADRHARGSPFGGAGAKRLRGQARHERSAHAAISRLFVRAMLSPRPRITVSILALSVTCGDTARVAAPSVCFALARILLAAAPTATPCFRRWRRSSPLLPEGEALSEPERCAKIAKTPCKPPRDAV